MKSNTPKYTGGDCVDFIKLTMANRTGLGGTPIYINVARIEAIRDEDDDAVVFVTGDNGAKYFVKESAESIMQMINAMKQASYITLT